MASPSFRRKSVSKSSPELLEKLLADGTRLDPTPEVQEAAEQLAAQGFISFEERKYVLCANARDTEDFRFVRNRDCRGRIYIEDGFDLFGDDYKCPDCERRIFPTKKHQYRELHIRILRGGLQSYVESALSKGDLSWKEIAPWLYRIDVGNGEVHLCVVDFCESSQHMTREWALANQNRVLWLVVHPRGKRERFLQEDWLSKVSFAELLSGQKDLISLLETQAECGPPIMVGAPSLPIYTKSRRHPTFEPEVPAHPDRLFIVQMGDREVFLNGQQVVARQSSTAFGIFDILYRRFLARLSDNTSSEESSAISARELCTLLYDNTGDDPASEDSLTSAIGRIRKNIEKAIKKNTGMPIDECDVIETVRWPGINEGESGYRLNPVSVAIRPFIPPESET
jgi:hypothetical protein